MQLILTDLLLLFKIMYVEKLKAFFFSEVCL